MVLNFLPILTGLAIYLSFARDMTTGGGLKFPIGQVLVAAFSLAAGGPETGTAAVVAATIAAGIILGALANEFRADRNRGWMYLTAAFLAPTGVILLSGYEFVYPRHFLVPILFCYVAVGNQLARWLAAAKLSRTIAIVVLAAFGFSNMVPVGRLVVEGRAQYSAAVRWMAEQSSGPDVVVAGDYDFRNSTVAAYHVALNADVYDGRGKQFSYVSKENYPPQGTEWYLRHNFSGDADLEPTWTDSYGNSYELLREFPAGSTSGWNWWLYRRR